MEKRFLGWMNRFRCIIPLFLVTWPCNEWFTAYPRAHVKICNQCEGETVREAPFIIGFNNICLLRRSNFHLQFPVNSNRSLWVFFFFKSSIGKLPRQQPIWSFIFPLFRAVWTKIYFDRSPSISTCLHTSLPRLIVGVNNFSVIAREKILACIIIPYTNGKTQTWREKDKETTSTQ